MENKLEIDSIDLNKNCIEIHWYIPVEKSRLGWTTEFGAFTIWFDKKGELKIDTEHMANKEHPEFIKQIMEKFGDYIIDNATFVG